jgi:orotidine-5'-phosphate decarboxylase
MSFAERLVGAAKRARSVAVPGLDPRPEQLPAEFSGLAPVEAVAAFNRELLAAVAGRCAAVKPNAAFYERLGPPGMRALAETIAAAKKLGLLVIADVKRGDVTETAKAYGEWAAAWGCDAITAMPWLGADSSLPFVEAGRAAGTGVFFLVKTSNPGSGEFQDRDVDGEPFYMHVARAVSAWGAGSDTWSDVGAVVGATHPAQAGPIRAAMPRTIFLVPGYGAQGGTAAGVRAAADAGGRGVVAVAGRSVAAAWTREPGKSKHGEKGWRAAVTDALDAMNADLASAGISADWSTP